MLASALINRNAQKTSAQKSFVYESDEEGGSDSDDLFTNALDLERRRFGQMCQDDKSTMLMLSMQRIYKLNRRMERRQRVKEQRDSVSLKDMVTKFRLMDTDHSGQIDHAEFKTVLADLDIRLGPGDYRLLFKQLDLDGDGQISIEEFKGMCKQQLRHFPMSSMDELLQQAVKEKMKEAKMMVYRGGIPSDDIERKGLRQPKYSLWDTHLHSPYEYWPKNACSRCRLRTHLALEDEMYNCLSMWIFTIIMSLIFVSTIAYVLESCPFAKHWPHVWWIIEWIVSITFSIEVILRLLVCRNVWNPFQRDDCGYFTWYLWDLMNVIDIMAVIPFYIDLYLRLTSPGEKGPTVLRVIRILRLLRIVRLRRFEFIRINMQTIHKALLDTLHDSCAIITAILCMTILLCSVFVYIIERGVEATGCDDFSDKAECELYTQPDGGGIQQIQCSWTKLGGETESKCVPRLFRSNGIESPFISIPETMWWCISTITTVGYGDIYPMEWMGKLIGALTMLAGVVVVAFFVVIIAGNFDRAHQHSLQLKHMLKKRTQRQLIQTVHQKSFESWAKDVEESLTNGDNASAGSSDANMNDRIRTAKKTLASHFRDNSADGSAEGKRKGHKHIRRHTAPAAARASVHDEPGSAWNSQGGSEKWKARLKDLRATRQVSDLEDGLENSGIAPGEAQDPGKPKEPGMGDQAATHHSRKPSSTHTKSSPHVPYYRRKSNDPESPSELPLSPGTRPADAELRPRERFMLNDTVTKNTQHVIKILDDLEVVGSKHKMDEPLQQIYFVLKSLMEPDDGNLTKAEKGRRKAAEKRRAEEVRVSNRRKRKRGAFGRMVSDSPGLDRPKSGHKKVRSKLPFYPEMSLIDPETGQLTLYNFSTAELPEYVRALGTTTTRDNTRVELAELRRTREVRSQSRSATPEEERQRAEAEHGSPEGRRSVDRETRQLSAIVNDADKGQVPGEIERGLASPIGSEGPPRPKKKDGGLRNRRKDDT